MFPHNVFFKEIIQTELHNFSVTYSRELKISSEVKRKKSPMVFLQTCQTLFFRFYKAELRAIFLLKRSEILTWYRCLYHKTEHHKCQQLASLLAASEKQPNSWRLNKSPTAQVDPYRSGLKRIQGPCREICSTPVTPFIILLWLVTYTNGSEKS